MVGSGRVNSLIHTGGKKINWGPVDSIRDILQISKDLSGPHILRVIAPPNSITLGLTPSKCKLLGDIQHTNYSSYTALLTYLWVLDWTLKTNERQNLYCTYFTTKIFFLRQKKNVHQSDTTWEGLISITSAWGSGGITQCLTCPMLPLNSWSSYHHFLGAGITGMPNHLQLDPDF